MEKVQRRKAERRGEKARRDTAAQRALGRGEERQQRQPGHKPQHHGGRAQQADAAGHKRLRHRLHQFGEARFPPDAEQLAHPAEQYRAVAHLRAADRRTARLGGHGGRVTAPADKDSQHRHGQQRRARQAIAENAQPAPAFRLLCAEQLIDADEKDGDEPVGQADVLGHGQHGQRQRHSVKKPPRRPPAAWYRHSAPPNRQASGRSAIALR